MGGLDYSILKQYKGKRVLVTGDTGFKGSWLSFLLSEVGATVKGLALAPLAGKSHFELLGLDKLIQHVQLDIRDSEKLKDEILSFRPEYVFHLAAQALVKVSYQNPYDTFSTNVMGSINLLDAVRACDSVESLVYITSDKCYENLEWVWGYRENDRMGGHDPYSASKGAAELVFSAYMRSYFNNGETIGLASARAGNVIGGGDWSKDRIIPDCIRAFQNDSSVYLRNPNATRPWQHVLEPISGYLLLGLKLVEDRQKYSGAWNFGPSSADVRSVYEVTQSVLSHLGRGSIQLDEQKHEHEANLLQLNCDKAHALLNWHPRWNVEDTLKYTAQWYKRLSEGQLAIDVTKEQLQAYFSELL
ncbi:CDP-glucose 4,6-dehydratase [Thiotrichales bacterium 19S11-10]|nr:CDP-glucose 4,6-dehydratase [Thiotrichales bacterium 19S11-10]